MDLRAWTVPLATSWFVVLMLLLDVSIGSTADLHAPCYACRIFNIMQRDNPKHDSKVFLYADGFTLLIIS